MSVVAVGRTAMWGALQNAAKAAQAVTQDTLINAQQLLERLDGQEEDGNDVEEEEGEEGEGGDAAAAAAAAAMGADAPLGVVPAAKDGEVAKLKKQLAAVKRENKELASDLELARQQAAATKKLLQESSGADQTEVNLLKAELVRYKELEELSQERDLLIQTLGTENEGVSARVVALEAENAQLRSAAADAAAAKDAEVAALRAQVVDLEKRATEALEVRACLPALISCLCCHAFHVVGCPCAPSRGPVRRRRPRRVTENRSRSSSPCATTSPRRRRETTRCRGACRR